MVEITDYRNQMNPIIVNFLIETYSGTDSDSIPLAAKKGSQNQYQFNRFPIH